jgi:hypothetical protein
MGFVLYWHTNGWILGNERGSKKPLGFSAHFFFCFFHFLISLHHFTTFSSLILFSISPSFLIWDLLFFEFYYINHYLMPSALPSFFYSSSLPLLPFMSPSLSHSSSLPFFYFTSPSLSQSLNFFPRVFFHWWHSRMCTYMINDTISCSKKLFVKWAHFKP